MAIKPVLRMGNPNLYLPAVDVSEFNSKALDYLIDNLFDTMIASGGIGIAATQIGVPLRVTVFGFEHSLRYPHADTVPSTILINPKVEFIGTDTNEDWESCLSTRGLCGLVNRYTRLRYSGYDQLGNFFEREVEGFHARLIQHEIDHLNGLLYVHRIKNLRYFGFEEELVELRQKLGSKLK